ncbi:MAG: hypothetical protein QG652_32 [Pseudomonadota bacterium]|nr:hypothetical protein [Pseudomonadota bacterium]
MQNVQQALAKQSLRDVSSTARLFNFNRPVFMSDAVWQDCVEMAEQSGQMDELAVLQRLRHVLFMASSALHGRVKDVECEFRIHRVPNNRQSRYPEVTTLALVASHDSGNQPIVTIMHPDE